MNRVIKKDGKIIFLMDQGKDFTFSLKSQTLIWGDYEEIGADVKEKVDMIDRPLIRLKLGEGFSIIEDDLVGVITAAQTLKIRKPITYTDIKLKAGESIIHLPIIEIQLQNTVTAI